MKTWVYLIKDHVTGLYKIGKSLDPYKRLQQLTKERTKMPIAFELELIEAWLATSLDEAKLHTVYKEERRRGEWFHLSYADRDNIFEYFYDHKKLSNDMSDAEEAVEPINTKTQYSFDAAERAAWVDFSLEGWGIEF